MLCVHFIFFYFPIAIPLTQRTACSLTCGPLGKGSPNFFSGRNDGAFFCAPPLQGFAGLSSSSTLRNLPRLFHLMCACLSDFPAPQRSAAIAAACVRVSALKVTRNWRKTSLKLFSRENPLEKGFNQRCLPRNRRYLLCLDCSVRRK